MLFSQGRRKNTTHEPAGRPSRNEKIYSATRRACPIRGRHRYGRDTKSLQGLQGMEVIVEELGSEIEQAGLHRTAIQTDVELKLRLAGITVLSREERLSQPGTPYLYINPTVVLGGEAVYYGISCELHQRVTLARNESISTSASTWFIGMTGGIRISGLQTIRDRIKDEVDTFINDYLSVNPKK
jgi:hypothetical protein